MTSPDAVFQALGHATRRDVIAQLAHGPAAVTTLALGQPMALPTFVTHLRVLEAAGLVRSSKRGRVRTYSLNVEPLREAESWLAGQRTLWEVRFDQLDAFLSLPEDP